MVVRYASGALTNLAAQMESDNLSDGVRDRALTCMKSYFDVVPVMSDSGFAVELYISHRSLRMTQARAAVRQRMTQVTSAPCRPPIAEFCFLWALQALCGVVPQAEAERDVVRRAVHRGRGYPAEAAKASQLRIQFCLSLLVNWLPNSTTSMPAHNLRLCGFLPQCKEALRRGQPSASTSEAIASAPLPRAAL
eukprot:3627765-Pleurochrysis_carterae.AAC.1